MAGSWYHEPMTVLIVLIGLVLSHYFTAVGRWRDFGWLLWPALQLRARFAGQPGVMLAALIGSVLLFSALATALFTLALGIVGWAILALATFIYTLGPRDLDRDVQQVLEAPSHADGVEAAQALGLADDDDAAAGAAAVLHAACTRWFAILFWFTFLGIPGALLYRLCQKAMKLEALGADELDWLARLRWVLEWPVLALMVLSAGLVSDLDRVVQAWKRYRAQRPWWLLSPALIDAVAAELLETAGSREEGLRRGHQLAWRMLVLWLVLMSVLLLAGWIV